MIEHNQDFPGPEPRPAVPVTARDIAGAYARLFHGDDGGRVLADLRAKFSHSRPRFPKGERPDHSRAAVIDGECNVLREIEEAIKLGTPSTFTQPKNKT